MEIGVADAVDVFNFTKIDQTTARTNFTLDIMFSRKHLGSIFAVKRHKIECRESIDSVRSNRFFER